MRQDDEGADQDRQRLIADASREIGVSARVLRYWEQLGVVRPSRDPRGRRHFSRHDLLAMSLIEELLESTGASISDLRLLREMAEREVEAALRDPLTRLRLLFQRQAAEPQFHQLIAERLPPRPPPEGERRPLLPHRGEPPLPPSPLGPPEG
jgi:DNA-binding transcriptional MerR regulator